MKGLRSSVNKVQFFLLSLLQTQNLVEVIRPFISRVDVMYKAVWRISILLYLYQNNEIAVKYWHTFQTKEFLPTLLKKKEKNGKRAFSTLLARTSQCKNQKQVKS